VDLVNHWDRVKYALIAKGEFRHFPKEKMT
jgi:hypothetical protein